MTTTWTFDTSVATRFQQEAITNIPDYEKVLRISLDYISKYSKESNIIEVGSALGHTVDLMLSAGYTNIFGIEASKDMIEKSLHKELILHSSRFPKIHCDIVLCNWTLHFIKDKIEYLESVYSNILPGGILILTEKTIQSEIVKNRYYQFKLDSGVSKEYILEKEVKLLNSMYLNSTKWYLDTLHKVGFQSVEIINARYGFVTFLCHK